MITARLISKSPVTFIILEDGQDNGYRAIKESDGFYLYHNGEKMNQVPFDGLGELLSWF